MWVYCDLCFHVSVYTGRFINVCVWCSINYTSILTLCPFCMQKCTKTLFRIRKKKQYYIKMKYLRQIGNKCFKEYISEKRSCKYIRKKEFWYLFSNKLQYIKSSSPFNQMKIIFTTWFLRKLCQAWLRCYMELFSNPEVMFLFRLSLQLKISISVIETKMIFKWRVVLFIYFQMM